MPIDSSIYGNIQAPDILGGIQQGMKLSDMASERRIRDQQAAAAQHEAERQYAAGAVMDANDQPSWDKFLENGTKAGHDMSALSREFDPALKNQIVMAAIPVQQRLEMQAKDQASAKDEKWKERQFSADQYNKNRDFALRAADVGAKRSEKSAEQQKMSVAEAKQMGLYNSGLEAEKQYQAAVGGKGWAHFDPSSKFQWIDKNDWAPNWAKSEESQAAHSAQDRWIESFLREASGAAIAPSEREAYAKQFFPVAGDSPQVIADKEKARQLKMESAQMVAKGGAGSGGGQAPMQPPAPAPINQASIKGMDLHSLHDDDIDKMYQKLGGGK
jgi:hypothetical protein